MITSAIRGRLTCLQKFVRDTRLSLTNIGNPMARCFLVPSLKLRAEMVKTISISLQKRNSFFQGAPSPRTIAEKGCNQLFVILLSGERPFRGTNRGTSCFSQAILIPSPQAYARNGAVGSGIKQAIFSPVLTK